MSARSPSGCIGVLNTRLPNAFHPSFAPLLKSPCGAETPPPNPIDTSRCASVGREYATAITAHVARIHRRMVLFLADKDQSDLRYCTRSLFWPPLSCRFLTLT